ncbi:hypothetical protein ACWCO0_09630 [Streptomyces tubercidicus]
MKHSRWIAAVLLVVVAVALVVGCDDASDSDDSFIPVFIGTVHHTTPRTTTPKYKVPAPKLAAPRVPSFSKGFRR